MSKKEYSKQELSDIAREKGYGEPARHIFLCTGDSCAKQQKNLKLWDYLKSKVNAIQNKTVLRSKSECLRVCKGGPIALVYPEGTLYHNLDNDKIDRVIHEHLINGQPVEEYSFFSQPLKSKQS